MAVAPMTTGDSHTDLKTLLPWLRIYALALTGARRCRGARPGGAYAVELKNVDV